MKKLNLGHFKIEDVNSITIKGRNKTHLKIKNFG